MTEKHQPTTDPRLVGECKHGHPRDVYGFVVRTTGSLGCRRCRKAASASHHVRRRDRDSPFQGEQVHTRYRNPGVLWECELDCSHLNYHRLMDIPRKGALCYCPTCGGFSQLLWVRPTDRKVVEFSGEV